MKKPHIKMVNGQWEVFYPTGFCTRTTNLKTAFRFTWRWAIENLTISEWKEKWGSRM